MQNHSYCENLFSKCIYVEIIQISYYSDRIILSYEESARFTETALIPSEPFECPSVHLSVLHFRTLKCFLDQFFSNFAWSGLGLQMG